MPDMRPEQVINSQSAMLTSSNYAAATVDAQKGQGAAQTSQNYIQAQQAASQSAPSQPPTGGKR